MSPYYNAFISYGRTDSKAFATKLNNDLTEAGWKIWFDQNDIPLAVDFQNQIDDGIEKADNFLFIIAPHSVNSEYCLKEINHALRHNKRIIPLLHVQEITYETWQQRNPGKTEADWEEYKQKGLHSSFPNMHPEIGRINWVYFRENLDDYDQSLTGLIELFRRDENYVSQHAQFLVKALEWERNQKQTRYLLIGKERQQAEEWLKIDFKDEQSPCLPTDLQCEFICESIKNANNLMTQVFLSYAEANRETMEKIRRSLLGKGITVWTSQTDIKAGKEFEDEINRGIEGADTLVLLLSPSAVESEYCQQEVSHALSLNKRLITLKIEPTDLDLLPGSIRSLEYINLTGDISEAEYHEGVDKLIKELGENAVYYQQHKVLLVKALKWQQQNRNRSILLRGYNLERYQSWLEVARTKNLHSPTDLQIEFIAESAKQPPDSAIDVFISYSRADSDVARRLNDALQSQGKTTWFDQESIATGTDFQQEIHRGIEQSDNFLFVISPDSANSIYCADEVEYARGLNKRFVTVLHREVNTADLHPELAKVHWLDFNRYGGDFLGNFSELVRALDTDREYVREHTKKSQAALEWSKGDKSVDLLLRGNECVRAYEWLQEVEQQGKQPELTEWLKEYIVASKDELERLQQQELRKQRRDKLVLSGFLVFLAGLSIFWYQTRRQNEIARAYQLAAQSQAMKAQYRGLHQGSAVLAVESMRKFQKLKQPLLEADRALRSGLALLPDFVWGMNHQGPVNAVVFSADGKYVATASDDNTARVWDVSTGKEVARLNHDDRVNAVAFSGDGKYVATASADNTARVWESDTGKEVTQLDHDGEVLAVTFSADGKYVATAGNYTARVWQPSTGKQIAEIHDGSQIIDIAFSGDSKYVATASPDNTARVWEPSTGKQIAKVRHNNVLNAVTLSADSKYVATASYDGTARVWESSTGKELARLDHDGEVRDVAFSADGKYLATASSGQTAWVWDVNTKKEITRVKHDGKVNAVAFSPDGKYIATASADNTAGVWDAATEKEIARLNHDGNVTDVVFSPDGKYIATASADNTGGVWDASTGQQVARLNQDKMVNVVALSDDGKYVATSSYETPARVWDASTEQEVAQLKKDWTNAMAFSSGGKFVATAGCDNTPRVFDASTGKEVAQFNQDTCVNSVALSADGKYLVTLDVYEIVLVWDVSTGTQVAQLHKEARVSSVALSADGKYVVTGGQDDTARVWEAATGKQVALLNHDALVNFAAFSDDGKYVVTASYDNTAGVWDASTGKRITRLNHDAPVNFVAFSGDGKYVATASYDNTAGVWDASTGKRLAWLKHDRQVNSVAFSADGKYVATTSADNTARVWEFGTDTEAVRIEDERGIDSVVFSADSQYVVTVSADKTVGVHFLQPAELVNEACSRLRRNLTADEWKKYMSQELHQYEKTCEDLPIHQSLIAEARNLLEENEVKKAEKLLGRLVKLDDNIDLLPTTEAIERDPRAVVRQFQAAGKVSEGMRRAQEEKIDEAIRLFQEAQELEPNIDLNPDTKEIEKEPEVVARSFPADSKVRQGVRLAREGKLEEAIHLFQEAQELEPDIDLNPNQKGKQIKPEKVARRLAARSKVWKGVELRYEGKVEEAIAQLKEAQELQSDIDLDPQTEEIENDLDAVVQSFTAYGKVRQGVQLASEGNIEDATRLFQEAQELQPDIDLNPYLELKQINPEKVARRLAAQGKVWEGVQLATEGKVEEAVRLFKEAQELQPDIDLDPQTEEIENDAETVAQQLAARENLKQE